MELTRKLHGNTVVYYGRILKHDKQGFKLEINKTLILILNVGIHEGRSSLGLKEIYANSDSYDITSNCIFILEKNNIEENEVIPASFFETESNYYESLTNSYYD